MTRKVLHILSQRPSLTGSGITLDALVRHATAAGWDQRVIVGTPLDDLHPQIGTLEASHILPLGFGAAPLPFSVPGMSDVMPYQSSVFSALTTDQIGAYLAAWRIHVSKIVRDFKPDIIHSHHIWLLSAILKDIAPKIPIATQCHATGLRQMTLCPHLGEQVRLGCARNDAFFTLRKDHSNDLVSTLSVSPSHVHMVGAGYRDNIFFSHENGDDRRNQILYTGKFAHAKGLHCLLDAVDKLLESGRNVTLHVAGSGAGPEAAKLETRMKYSFHVKLHGQLSQEALAKLMRKCSVCVLPSFYEGVPLVLVEAIACGCRVVSTNLPGVVEVLAPAVASSLDLVTMPTLCGVDTPTKAAIPSFIERLSNTLESALDKPPVNTSFPKFTQALESFTWKSVFKRVQKVWLNLCNC